MCGIFDEEQYDGSERAQGEGILSGVGSSGSQGPGTKSADRYGAISD
jgi:hypothetical protein